jgi:hypothetical protein
MGSKWHLPPQNIRCWCIASSRNRIWTLDADLLLGAVVGRSEVFAADLVEVAPAEADDGGVHDIHYTLPSE